jgi:hypothetical protein
MQSVPITTKVVSTNPVHGEVHSVQHCVIMFITEIVESGVKHHNPNPKKHASLFLIFFYK